MNGTALDGVCSICQGHLYFQKATYDRKFRGQTALRLYSRSADDTFCPPTRKNIRAMQHLAAHQIMQAPKGRRSRRGRGPMPQQDGWASSWQAKHSATHRKKQKQKTEPLKKQASFG